MSATPDFGFGKFVPGFDFLQSLAKGASQAMPQMPSMSSWVAPTLNVEELDKRISELQAVHFWLEQNGKALSATIQALEVQKMTLATLQGMNFNMGEVANALQVKTADAMAGMQKMTEAAAGAAGAAGAAPAADEPPAAARPKARARTKPGGDGTAAAAGAAVDPLQWWGALTQQFQEIAAHAMQDVAQKAAPETSRPSDAASARKPAARKAAARKSAARKGASKR